MKRLLLFVTAAAAAAAATASVAAAGADLQLTAVGRLPFPARGFVVDLPAGVQTGPNAIQVRENGLPVRNLLVSPIDQAGVRFGVVLAVDASESMIGKPLSSAIGAARTFVSRLARGQQVGLIAFNERISVLQQPTADLTQLTRTLSTPPSLRYGTRMYDAVDRALALLARSRLSVGSIVLLSDGADIGSRAKLARVIATARARHVRIFTVGLRSGAFEAGALQRLAAESGGTYAEASSSAGLSAIYATLREKLSGEYLIRYRSDRAPKSHVNVSVAIRGVGTATSRYTAPTPSGLAPFHRSLLSRFLLSPGAPLLLSLLVAALIALGIATLLRRPNESLVDRVEGFAGRAKTARIEEAKRIADALVRRQRQSGWFGRLEAQLEVARIDMTAARVVLLTAAGTVTAIILLGLISPVFAVLGLLTPLVTRSLIGWRLQAVRDEFADQLPPNLQVLASALRVGHSFIGALTVVTENAHEPSRSELRRVLTDEQLGVPVDEAVQRVAARMASRDLEQVALLAELQRTAGGNAAEVLDTVVETLRERADLRRLVRTLTAQGRMARWILTALPVLVFLAVFLLRRDLISPLYSSNGGEVALVIGALMVVSGSLVIKRIVDIDV